LALFWSGPGWTLEQAPTLFGPWTTNAHQANPQMVPASANALFFRLVE